MSRGRFVPKRRLRAAIVGCGRIALRHALILASLPDIDVEAFQDVDVGRARTFSRRFGGRAYADVAEMLERESPDLVSICTPPASHAGAAVAAARCGVREVLVEKPIALTLADADEMIRACDRAGARLGVVQQNRYHLPIRKLSEAVGSGRFGRLVLGSARVRWCRPQRYYDEAPWRGKWSTDGGLFANQAVHHVDMLLWLMGRVTAVSAFSTTRLASIEADDTGIAILKFRSGALGVLEATTAARPSDLESSISILGENGAAEVGGTAMNEMKIWRFASPLGSDDDALGRFRCNPADPVGFGHREFLSAVVAAARAGQAPPVEGREARRSLEVVDAIYRSVREGCEIELGGEDHPSAVSSPTS